MNKIKKSIHILNKENLDLKSFFLIPFFLLIAMEIMHVFYADSFTRIFTTPFYLIKCAISYVFLLSVESIILVITQRIVTTNIILCSFFYMISFASDVLCDTTGDPLLPSDLLLIKNIGNIASFATIPITVSRICALMLVVFSIYYIMKKHQKVNVSLKTKMYLSFVGVLFFCVTSYFVCLNYTFRHETLKKINVEISAFNPIDDYISNGFILTFFPRIGDLVIQKPQGYDEEKINEIKNSYSSNNDAIENKKTTPNVIAIQSEAWWDPTLLPNVAFSQDPMELYRKWSEKYFCGDLISPVFGGGTCMPEFEFLTALTTNFLPASVYPYIQSITSPTVSLASSFKDNNYETIALHTYKKNFYGRNKAYPLLGFDNFIGATDLVNPEMKGLYISDMEMSREIIKNYENKQKERMFLFAVSMQNHGGYNPKRYGDDQYVIDVQSDVLSEEDLQGLKDYSQGVYDANLALQTLFDYFSQVKDPTIIVMYGDHLPLLGTDGSIYTNTGFVEKKDVFVYSDFPQLYRTPYVVWANYNISKFDFPAEISPANLGLSVYKMTGLKNEPWHFSLIDDFYKKYPVYNAKTIQNNNQVSLQKINESDTELETDYKYIQYDILNGKQYSQDTQKNETTK